MTCASDGILTAALSQSRVPLGVGSYGFMQETNGRGFLGKNVSTGLWLQRTADQLGQLLRRHAAD